MHDGKKYLNNLGLIVITAVITVLVTHFGNKFLEYISYDNEITYRILSDQILNRSEIEELVNSNFNYKKIDFSYDDNIIDTYHLTLIELKNMGDFIEDDLIFDIDFVNNDVKVIDALGKISSPIEKELDIKLGRVPLKFETTDKDTLDFYITWADDSQKFGAIVYRSFLENSGYGRRNAEIIYENEYTEKILRKYSYYYRLLQINENGIEGELSPQIKYPESMFNKPDFKHTKSIYPKNIPFNSDSLIERIINENSLLKANENIYVDVNKMDIKPFYSELTSGKNNKIYYKDDLKFLYGYYSIKLNNMDDECKYKIYLVSKSYIKNYYKSLKISLRDTKDISIKKLDVSSRIETLHEQNDSIKKYLTPFKTTLLQTQDTIFISWCVPNISSYYSVRLFKSKLFKNKLSFNFGNEIYEGKGTMGLILNSDSPQLKELGTSTRKFTKTYNLAAFQNFTPPSRKSRHDSKFDPNMPSITNLRILTYPDPLNIYEGQIMPFFADTAITISETYKYTLVIQDSMGNYSYPIESVIKYQPDSTTHRVSSYIEYECNPILLKCLKHYFKRNEYTLQWDIADSLKTELPDTI